jgi:hypothetical protein
MVFASQEREGTVLKDCGPQGDLALDRPGWLGFEAGDSRLMPLPKAHNAAPRSAVTEITQRKATEAWPKSLRNASMPTSSSLWRTGD